MVVPITLIYGASKAVTLLSDVFFFIIIVCHLKKLANYLCCIVFLFSNIV